MTNYKVVDGIASTPKGQQLYDQASAQQNANRLTNLEHQSTTKKIAGVSNRPTTAPRAFQWYATRQDLIERGFPTIDGIPTPVTFEQAKQQGYADHQDYRVSGKGKYHKFYTDTYNNRSKQSTSSVLDRQEIYRQITGKSTFAYHGCNEDMCPQWNQHGNLISNVLRYFTGKTNNQPVETSATMYQGLPRTSYHLQPDLDAPKPEPVSEPEPEIIAETKTEIIAEPIAYSLPLIAGVVIVILLLLRRKNG